MNSFSWQSTVPVKINLLGALHCKDMPSSCFSTKLWKWSSDGSHQELSLAYSVPSPASSWVYWGVSSLFSYMSWSWTKSESSGVPQPCYPLHKAGGVPARPPIVQEWPPRAKCSHTHKLWLWPRRWPAVSGTEGQGWARAGVKRWKGTS